jgi:hypothetical protein
MEQTQQKVNEVFEQKAALKVKPSKLNLSSLAKMDRQELFVGAIFITSLLLMLVWAIHSVDVLNGVFP